MQDSPHKWEIIAVENSTINENTSRWFNGERAVFRTSVGTGQIKYIFDPVQCGPHARNTGARAATGDFVMFMDAHTGLGKNSISPLVDFLIDTPIAGGVSGLTSWSSYEYDRMGSYYELFLLPDRQPTHTGGPTLDTHMHGHYMALGYIKDRRAIEKKLPVRVVMGSQAYTMYRTKDFLDCGGYCDEARFYPHPEGYMPLKLQMMGKEIFIHTNSYHFHSLFPRTYASSNHRKILDNINGIIDIEMDLQEKINNIKTALMFNEPDEGHKKIEEYGGFSWGEHGHMNVYKIAYILGEDKWTSICNNSFKECGSGFNEDKLKEIAIEQVKETRNKLVDRLIYSLDDILTMARKQKICGMENWFNPIGPDPLGV